MPGRKEADDESRRRALADLERIRNPGGKPPEPAADSLQAPEDDAIEKWGKLIGRSLGVLFLVYLIYWLSTKLL